MFRGTQVPAGIVLRISPTGLSPPAVTLSFVFGYPTDVCTVAGPTTPGDASPHPRFGLLRVRSPLLAQSLLFSFPAGTEMFQFPAFAPMHQHRCGNRFPRVSPFGHLRVKMHLPLAAAFRSLSRPSSPPRATGIPHAPLFAFSFSFAFCKTFTSVARFSLCEIA